MVVGMENFWSMGKKIHLVAIAMDLQGILDKTKEKG